MAGYGEDQDLTDWLAAQGFTLPDGAPSLAVLRQIGADYVDAAYEHRLQCSRRAGGFDQERAWPREGHVVGGQVVSGVPDAWVRASFRAAWLEASEPGWATGTVDPGRVARREKVDVIEVEYFAAGEGRDKSAGKGGATDALIEGMVSGLLCTARGLFFAVA